MQFMIPTSHRELVRPVFERVCAHFGYVPAESCNTREEEGKPPKIAPARYKKTILLSAANPDMEFSCVTLFVFAYDDGDMCVNCDKNYGTTDADARYFNLVDDIINTTAVSTLAFTDAKLRLLPNVQRSIVQWTRYVEISESLFGKIPKRRFKKICSEVGIAGRGYPQKVSDLAALEKEKLRQDIVNIFYGIMNNVSDKMEVNLYARGATQKRFEKRAFALLASVSLDSISASKMPDTLSDLEELRDKMRVLRDIWREAPRISHEQHNDIFLTLELRGEKIQGRREPTETGHAYCRAYADKMNVDVLLEAVLDGVPIKDVLA